MPNTRRLLLTLSTALVLSACAVGPDYERPNAEPPIKWPWERIAESTGTSPAPTAAVNASTAIPLDWWKSFNDPALTALVEEALEQNADLGVAAARVAEAHAVLDGENANLLPRLGAEASATRTSQSREARFGPIALSNRPFNQISLSAVLDWEIDLWGKLRRASESARAQLLSTKANQDAVRLAIVSDVASGYFNLRALDAQIEVTEQTITAREEAYDYQRKQFEAGAVDGLTYKQAEAELAATRAQLPILRQARVEQENLLAVLVGRTPQALVDAGITRGSSLDALPTPPAFRPDMPSTLLERRPDVQVAEQTLISSNAQIGLAKADYFPTLSLNSLLGLGSANADRLLRTSARTWSAGVNSAMPLVDFGRTSSRVDAAEARKQVALLQYQQSVRKAFAEVMDSMNAIQNTAEQTSAQTMQTDARTETLRIVQLRYNAGYSNYLEVLDAQRQLFQAQLDLITAKRAQLTAAVNLYKALGGGWEHPGDEKAEAQADAIAAALHEGVKNSKARVAKTAPALVEEPKQEAAPTDEILTVPAAEPVSEPAEAPVEETQPAAPAFAPVPSGKPTPPAKPVPPSMQYLKLPDAPTETPAVTE
jgi:multidrug efflux system outer membrane protein